MYLERLDPARHAAAVHAACAVDDGVWAYLPYGPFDNAAAYRDWIAVMAAGRDPYFYAICDASGHALGVASYLRITPAVGVIEIGHICLSPALQRSVMATEALSAMIRWAFEAGYRRVEWKCDAANVPSCKAAERLGLSYEGIFRQATIVKGRNRDTAWFAAIDAEWPRLRAAYDAWLSPANFDQGGAQRQSLSAMTRPIVSNTRVF